MTSDLLYNFIIINGQLQIMDNFIRELEGQFPSKDTVYEYYIDVKQKFWVLWEDKLRSGYVVLNFTVIILCIAESTVHMAYTDRL